MTRKRPKKSITIRSRNLFLLQVMYRQITELETIIKVHGDNLSVPDPYLHLGLVRKKAGWEPHLTNEKEPDPDKKHHFLRSLSNEDSIRLLLQLFSAPDSPPPALTSIENKEEVEEVWTWLEAAVAKTVHSPHHRMIRVFRQGPIRNAVTGLLNSPADALDVDLYDALKLKDTDMDDPKNFELVFEDHFESTGLELGFLKHPQRVVLLSPGKPVVELRIDSLLAWIKELRKLPGVEELLKELERKGLFKRSSNSSH